VNCYGKPFEIRVDEIDVNGRLHHTKVLQYCSHTRYCQLAEMGWTVDRMAAHGIGAVTFTEGIRYRLEVRLGDLITATHQVIGYSADGTRWCTRNQVMRPDGAIAAIVTTTGAWFGLRSRRIQGIATPAGRGHRRHPVARLHRPLRADQRSTAGHRPNRYAARQCSTLAATLTIFPALKAVGTSAKPERLPMKYLAVSTLVGTGLDAVGVVLTSTCRRSATHSADVAVFAVNTPGDKAQTV
jgi:acyl-CoA thioester hydrolase